MVMKNKKLILIILIVGLFTSGVALGAGVVYLITIETSDTNEIGLTAEQYQLLTISIMQSHLEELGNVEIRNAWKILDAMREVDFVENTYQGESGAAHATWILDMLGIGEIQELTVIEIQERFPGDLSSMLVMRIINETSNVYYLFYDQTWGLGIVREDNENGEMIFGSLTHFIRDGQICHRITGECR